MITPLRVDAEMAKVLVETGADREARAEARKVTAVKVLGCVFGDKDPVEREREKRVEMEREMVSRGCEHEGVDGEDEWRCGVDLMSVHEWAPVTKNRAERVEFAGLYEFEKDCSCVSCGRV